MNRYQGIVNRRRFISLAASAAGAVLTAPRLALSSTANERIGLGFIGQGGRGDYLLGWFLQQDDARVVAVCDVRANHRERAANRVNGAYGNRDCGTHSDFRELLARPDVDAVVIATGDNNHALVSIMAARAGKDVFCEKPMSLTIAESRSVSDTMRRMGRVYQLGTQRRNVAHFRFAVELARSGRLGRLTALHAEQYTQWHTLRDDVLPAQPEPAKDRLDWDLWLGPASWRPFNETYTSRGFWGGHVDFGGGAIPEWGSHTIDICQWAKEADHTGPVSFAIEGNRYVGQYADGTKLIIRNGLRFGTCPVRFEGEEGWVETGDNGEIDAFPRSLLEDRSFRGGYPVDGHGREFLNCVRSRRLTASNAEVGHRSNTACQVANICKRLQRPVQWDPVKEAFVDDDEANRMRSRAYRAPFFM